MNRISIHSVKGITPLEAVFGTKSDLSNIHKQGKKYQIRTKHSNKLGGRVQTGYWIGLDDKSKGHCVYWPDKQTVSVKYNIYFDKLATSAFYLEREEEEPVLIKTKPDQPIYITFYQTQGLAVTALSEKSNQKVTRIKKPSKHIQCITNSHLLFVIGSLIL